MWELFGSHPPFRVVSADATSDHRLEVFGLAERGSVWQECGEHPVCR